MRSKVNYFIRKPLQIFIVLLIQIPYFHFIRKRKGYNTIVIFEFWFKQKILNIGGNKKAYWPVHSSSTIHDVDKIKLGVDSAPGIMGGAYITGTGGLDIGSYCFFAKNITIVTANHDLYDNRKRNLKPVKIGDYCWVAAGVHIMPGVTLGDFVVIGAGAVVTKSFNEGYCVIGGNPAIILKKIDPTKCIKYKHAVEYIGYKKVKQNGFNNNS